MGLQRMRLPQRGRLCKQRGLLKRVPQKALPRVVVAVPQPAGLPMATWLWMLGPATAGLRMDGRPLTVGQVAVVAGLRRMLGWPVMGGLHLVMAGQEQAVVQG